MKWFKVFTFHDTFNVQCNVSSAFNLPSVMLGELIRSSGRYRTAPGDHLQLWSQDKGQNHQDF